MGDDTVHHVLLAGHVLAGTAALLLGPAWAATRLRGQRGEPVAWSYQATVALVATSGALLALTTPGLAPLLPVAVLTEALAVTGALARRRDWRRWPVLQPHLLGGSYIALVTALLVAETRAPLLWVLPTVVGQLPIALAKRRLHAPAAAGGPGGRQFP